MKRLLILLMPLLMLTAVLQSNKKIAAGGETAVYLPIILNEDASASMVEFRGVWVSRFDWTLYGEPANPAKIDEIVQNVADAGFNVIFFQVRSVADAYYTPGLEPWAERVSGIFGQPPDPLWDPLARMIEKAHAAGIQVHAYMNAYPVWNGGIFCNTSPESSVSPAPLYHLLLNEHGSTDDKPNGLIWGSNDEILCDAYQRATPSSPFLQDHLIAVGSDLATRYDIDGLHLDHIRYGFDSSCDPVSEAAYGAGCFSAGDYGEWQRMQVNNIVQRFYEEVVPLKPNLWLSAAVWPIHELKPAWSFPGFPEVGNLHYYQDSKAWLAGGYIDSISPMIYPGSSYNYCDDEGNYVEDPALTSPDYWIRDRWQLLVNDFQADSNGRFIIPGIGTGYCSFAEIEARILLAREAGTVGHSLFSYNDLLVNDYFDALANGPYAETAVVPSISWHP